MIVVAGNASLQTHLPIPGFPLAYEPVRYPTGQVHTQVSGVAFLVAEALARLGHEVRLAAMVGDDPAGQAVRAAVDAAGIDPAGLVATPVTPQAVVLVAPDGQRSVHTDLKDVQTATYLPELFAEVLEGAEVAVLTNIGWVHPLLQQTVRAQVPIATDVQAISRLDDPYNADWMRAATILACSHEQLPRLPEHWANTVLKTYLPEIHLVGMGADGALIADWVDQPNSHRAPRLAHIDAVAPRGVTDTTGAGDALMAGFLDGWLRGHTPPDAAVRAVTLAGWRVGGGRWLTAAELDALTAGPSGLPSSPLR